ncbi:hemolymph lipopolysaccharide-binding protein-like, partial [Cryptotermes secundus]|uniref:hemolymph lipopolysaccharide-binding protein-like n=1 Tax=Cryptotermes secundus TaxID=105785 RepID=UPI000CD7B93B
MYALVAVGHSASGIWSRVTPRNWYFSVSNSNVAITNSEPGQQQLSNVTRYSFHTTGKKWDEARRICDQEGSHLAIINSEAESRVLHDLYALTPFAKDVDRNNWAFIGFHDRFVKGEFLTIQ